jgi:hypothetical protein
MTVMFSDPTDIQEARNFTTTKKKGETAGANQHIQPHHQRHEK